jgi:hypothetical protein
MVAVKKGKETSPAHFKEAVSLLSQSCFNKFLSMEWDPKMSSSLANGYAERSRIEQEIRQCDLSLLKINGERLRLAAGLAECNLFRQLLARRQHALGTRYRNSARWYDGGVRRSGASR